MPIKVITGINDVATLHPHLVAEADGWDPSTVLAGNEKKMPWKCKEGHTWEAVIETRTGKGSRCPHCAEYGLILENQHGSI